MERQSSYPPPPDAAIGTEVTVQTEEEDLPEAASTRTQTEDGEVMENQKWKRLRVKTQRAKERPFKSKKLW